MSVPQPAMLGGNTRPSLARLLAVLGPLLALLLLWVGFGVAVALNADADTINRWSFFGIANQKLMLEQSAIVIVAACGMTMIIVSGGIDLSAGSVIALSSVVAALALRAGWGPCAAVGAAIATGAVAGAINGAIVSWGRLVPFIVTLGMMGVARGLAKGFAGNQSVNFEDDHLAVLMHTPRSGPNSSLFVQVLGVAPGVWIALGLVLLTALLMSRTVFGRYIYALGSNEAAARLCGISVQRTKFFIYALAGAAVGLGGALETARLSVGDPSTAAGRELDVIAAVVIGGASLAGGTGTVFGAAIGALITAVLRSGSQQMGWPTYVQEIIIGLVIVLAVAVDRLRQRRRD